MAKLDIYQPVEGQDDWPLIDTLEAETPEAVIELAERVYGSNDYHWTNPYDYSTEEMGG